MTLAHLLPLLEQEERLADALGEAASTSGEQSIVAPAGVIPAFAAALAQRSPGPVVAVTATTRQSEDLAATLRSFLGDDAVAVFPSWETLPHERLSPSADVVGRRLAVLRRIVHPGQDPTTARPPIVVAPVRALLQPLVAGLADLEPLVLRSGEELDPMDAARLLVRIGYTRTDLVERRGQFAIRGGVLDVFPPTEEHPVRIEFWGDTVEEVRSFAVADQRSLDLLERGLWAPPCRELPFTDEIRQRAADLVAVHPELTDLLDAIADGRGAEGIEALSPLLADRMELFVDLLPPGSRLVLAEPQRIADRAAELLRTSEEFLAASWHNVAMSDAGLQRAPIDLAASAYRELDDVRERARERDAAWIGVSPFGGDVEREAVADPAPHFQADLPAALAVLRSRADAAATTIVVVTGQGTAKRLAESLAAEGIATRSWTGGPVQPGPVHLCIGLLDTGFRLPATDVLVLSDADLFGAGASGRGAARMPAKRRRSIDPLSLRPGDHVVHDKHGVGKYVEMTTRTVGGTTREYMVVEYAPSKRGHPPDKLFLPTDQLDEVTRYIGGDAPSLHKLGGSDWAAAKGRARKAVKQIAGELIRLYAARQHAKGHAFGKDTPWQAELEDSFGFVETPDQLATVNDVKADMEQTTPMDRLVCGDVGYGKTEIAVRAAFKAIADGKQVALLVPTTLLVQQHLRTFTERYAAFPVRIAAMSRFTPPAQAKEILAGLADGTIDLAIGTHSLLSAKVQFKDLGLVIIDEEQRFGVEHKEHLKAMRADVDVLTMSATPIPRTLEMAVTGIREMSTIATPPEERLPILTYVGPYDDRQVGAAIRRELLREGQVFFVHNRVASIDRIAGRLRELVPEARIATAHGQMGEHKLEQIIVDFWEKRIDVLVCTTIVESGIDIANANTLIVDRADTYGLSQLHQLRGRVGRGRDRAYAYFMYGVDKPLTETAYDRLATIAGNTDLGAGMQVAMKDLEIRGAGNLLGGEQSGHIADVGFDLYVRLVGEALAEYKGEARAEEVELSVTLPIDAHLPETYVAEERLRLEAYKRLAAARTDDDVDEVVAELTDRYGQPPQEMLNLVAISRLRALAHRAGLTDITAAGTRIRLHPVTLPDSRAVRLSRLYPGATYKAATRQVTVPVPMTKKVGGQALPGVELVEWAAGLVRSVLLDEPAVAVG